MKIKEGFLLRQVAADHVVVPVGSKTVDFRCIITLNESGAFLWQLLQQETTVESVVQALLQEYDVTEEMAVHHVEKFIGRLRENNLLDE